MRKDIREEVKKYMNDGMKPKFTELARQYGCDYRTVKAACESAKHPQAIKHKRQLRPSKLDQYKGTIHTERSKANPESRHVRSPGG